MAVTVSGYASKVFQTTLFPGAGPTGFINLTNASGAPNGSSALALVNQAVTTQFIRGTSFGLSIPSNATLTSAIVSLYVMSSGAAGVNSEVIPKIYAIGTNPILPIASGINPTLLPFSSIQKQDYSFSVSSLTSAAINNTGFYAGFCFENQDGVNGIGSLLIDAIALSVTYDINSPVRNSYPNFFLEQPEGTHNPTPQYTPLWSKALWSQRNVWPEVKGSWNNLGFQNWPLTPSGLASGMAVCYNFWASGYTNNIGRSLEKYYLNIAGLGNGRYTSNRNSSGNYLFNNFKDMSVGASGVDATNNINQDYFVPWATTGIYQNRVWGSGFWPELRKRWNANNIPDPTVWGINTENFGDSSRGVVPAVQGTGWATRALSRIEASSVLFDGVNTFLQYWNNTTGWYDGTIIPTGLQDSTYWQYGPVDAKFRSKSAAAYWKGHNYATYKGIIEPMYNLFGSGFPVVEYQVNTSNLLAPVPHYFPGQDECLQDTYYLTGQAYSFYNEAPYTNNAQEDGIPPYWPSVTGWVAMYPTGANSTYSARDYASLRWAQDRANKLQFAKPNIPVYVWLSATGDSCIPIMVDLIKYCHGIGVSNFVIFDPDIIIGESAGGGGHERWNTIIDQVNRYYDELYIKYVPFNLPNNTSFALNVRT